MRVIQLLALVLLGACAQPMLRAESIFDSTFFTKTKQGSERNAWTWFYAKQFDNAERAQFHNKNQATFLQVDTQPFSQLIFSWNALKPNTGHFSFYVQARSTKTKQWLPWHKMIDWGNSIQRSYISKEHDSQGMHVRLEVPDLADGYRLRVEAHDGADLGELRGLFVNIADLKKFIPDAGRKIAPVLKTVHVDDVPKYSQMVLQHPRAPHLCSPTSLSMLLAYVANAPVNPVQVAHEVYDAGLDTFGSWPFNVAFAFQATGCQRAWWHMRLPSFVDLHRQLARGVPVMVSVQGPLKGGATGYTSGHLLLVVGYDARHKKVICHDPAFDADEKTVVKYDLNSFLTAWGRRHNFAIMVDSGVA